MNTLQRDTEDGESSSMKRCHGRKILFFAFLIFIITFVFFVHAQEQAQQSAQQPADTGAPVKSPRGTGGRTIEEERLNILKTDIQKEIDQYKKLKKEMEEAQKTVDEKSQEKLARVAKMFEAMPVEDAARKLEKLDEDTAVAILTAVKPKTAGKILAQIETEKAVSLSKKILSKGPPAQEKTSR